MKINQKTVVGLFLIALMVAPSITLAANAALSYQPQTQAEKIAYIYGRISQLLEMQQQLKDSGQTTLTTSVFDYITIDTYGADEETEVSAVLRGEVLLFGKETASAWFEYGKDSDFLDLKTSQRSVRSAYDRAVRTTVTRLEDDQRYYFRLAAVDSEKVVHYGPISSFRTDESDE